ncbi:type II toxin-antitoxin system MqsR family toxin [Salinicoccus cyprini]|uniref:type II toxin-antitoxin system MqsR family toxin n=1 Tax=Salinicoccus cyprini TaxID=2493691 RepID=UPI00164383E4|nr:type II toxin-antitoxin system MqsR family toxin [Salinicoccus cyprini]
MRNASKDEINHFLKRFRKYMHKPHNFRFVRREFDFTMLGLTLVQAKSIVSTLKYTDYYKGPSPDHNGDGTDIWVFGKLIDGEMAYIKLKISNDGLCKCLSFKPAEKPMLLPYKK